MLESMLDRVNMRVGKATVSMAGFEALGNSLPLAPFWLMTWHNQDLSSSAGSDDSAVYRVVSAVFKVTVHVGAVLGGAQFPLWESTSSFFHQFTTLFHQFTSFSMVPLPGAGLWHTRTGREFLHHCIQAPAFFSKQANYFFLTVIDSITII